MQEAPLVLGIPLESSPNSVGESPSVSGENVSASGSPGLSKVLI